MFDLPTHPDGNFYSIPETNQIVEEIDSKISATNNIVEEIGSKIAERELASGADLNDLVNTGYYKVTTSAIAGSLLNKPSDLSASCYIVIYAMVASVAVIQIIYTATKIYCRRKTSSGFGKWYIYTGTQEQS